MIEDHSRLACHQWEYERFKLLFWKVCSIDNFLTLKIGAVLLINFVQIIHFPSCQGWEQIIRSFLFINRFTLHHFHLPPTFLRGKGIRFLVANSNSSKSINSSVSRSVFVSIFDFITERNVWDELRKDTTMKTWS